MMIEGVSQSTGAERRVEIAAAADGVRVAIRDSRKGTVLAFVTAPADGLMTVLTDQPPGPQSVAGDTAGAARTLEIEIRRNEVLLAVGGVDAAVGLDDLMDALAAALPA
ncbi:MAG TPA: hypothetical protein VH092_11985 [Urbifossiella sp.]|jgi:hypothetical protein|nr:hypothetical protein [Urbifossiella sp.]